MKKKGLKRTKRKGGSKTRLHWNASVAKAVLFWGLKGLVITILFVTTFLRRARWPGMWFPLAESTPSCYFSRGILEGVRAATR